MSNGRYSKGREKFLSAQIDWLNDDIKAALIDAADYTVNLAIHEFLSDIPLIGRTAISNSLADKTVTNGWAGSSNIVFENPVGDISEAIVIFKDTGDAATSPLIAYLDTNIQNLPLFLNGAKVTIIFDEAVDGIFRI